MSDRHPIVKALVLATERVLVKQGAISIASTWHASHVCETKVTLQNGSTAQIVTSVNDQT